MLNKSLLIFIFSFATVYGHAQTVFNPTQADIDSAFAALDYAIAHKAEYQAARTEKMEKLAHKLDTAKGASRMEILKELVLKNMNFRGKEVLRWVNELKKTDEYKIGGDLYVWTQCREAQAVSAMGLTHRALSTLYKLDPEKMSDDMRCQYNDILLQVYNWEQSTFNYSEAIMPEEEKRRKDIQTRQSEIIKDSTDLVYITVCQLMEENRAEEAIKILSPLYNNCEGQDVAYFYGMMADLYLNVKDTTKAIYSLAMTSIADLELANTEYMCLPVLVDILHRKGDIDHAYRYLLCCMEDTRLYPAYFLTGETTNIFPIINNEYQLMKAKKEISERRVNVLLSFCGFLLICGVFLGFYLRYRYKMMRQLKIKNEQLEKANQVRSAFIANMTHEIRTPLNAIGGFAQLLSTSGMELDSESVQQMANEIYIGSCKLTGLFDNVIDITNLDSGQSDNVTLSNVLVKQIIDKAVERLLIPDEKPVSLRIDNKLDSSFEINTNANLLSKAIFLVLDNGIKFTDEGEVVLSVSNDGNKCMFTVTDTGRGIPKDKYESVFERFVKLDEFIPGTGLGLSLCRCIMDILKGQVYIDPTYTGKGTRFVLSHN